MLDTDSLHKRTTQIVLFMQKKFNTLNWLQ